MLPAIGLDLGASKAVMAVLAEGEPQLILNREHSPLTPAALGLGPAEHASDGQSARAPEPAGGLTYGHAALEPVEQAVQMWLPRLAEAAPVRFNGLDYTPPELTALFLARLREEAEAALGAPLGRVVLAAPLAFGQRQVALLRQAARRAGLLVLTVVPSTMAAALAYCREHPEGGSHTMLTCDFGAGSLGVAVLRAFPGALMVLGQAGEAWLGGEDLTQTIVAHLVRRLQGERGVLLDESQAARQTLRRQLRRAAERAKVALSTVQQASIVLTPDAMGLPVGLDEPLRRAQLEEMAAPRLEEALGVVERALAGAGLAGESIDAVLLAGGAAQMPLWQARLGERLRRACILRDFNPLTGVAMGAALWAGLMSEVRCPTCGLRYSLEAVACRRCGSSLAGEPRLACPRCFMPNDTLRLACSKCGASLRAARREVENLAKVPNLHKASLSGSAGLRCGHCGLTAPAGAVSCPNCGGVVAPFVGGLSRGDLGVERESGRMDVILPRGQALPTPLPVSRAFAAGAALGPLEIAIYEGDKPFACQNERCGTLRVDLPADLAPRSSVRVTFSLDREGMLNVSARLGDGSDRELDVWLEWA